MVRWMFALAGLSLVACSGSETTSGETPDATAGGAAKSDGGKAGGKADGKVSVKPPVEPPKPIQEPLVGGPRPALLLAQAWFWKDENGKPNPGPARLEIWRQDDGGEWDYTRLEDGDSNVFHKALPYDGGILTIGAEGARLKKWTWDGKAWSSDLLWEQSWGGKFNRLRDVEIGDVDGDGKDEIVVVTHDAGVVAVVDMDSGKPVVTELDQKADTFVHEVEIGDIDGDGKNEFFCTPSDRNQADASQAGGVAMYKYEGGKYTRSWVDNQEGTHAKEILAYDMDGDGTSELFGVMEAHLVNKKIETPVQIRQYQLKPDGTFDFKVVASIEDRQTRFLVPGDYDHDGKVELMAAAYKAGIFYIEPDEPQPDGSWKTTRIAQNSSGFEHAAFADDLDGDGKLELYVAADDQHELRVYRFNEETKKFDSKLLGELEEKDVLTWNITTAEL
jgi:hypothetical protein